MIRVNRSKSIICSKSETKILNDLLHFYTCMYELPLFDLKPKRIMNVKDIRTDYVLIRPNLLSFTETFMNSVNKTWNKLYEG